MDIDTLTDTIARTDRASAAGRTARLQLLKAVADPTRLAIVDRLASCGDRCHCDLEADLGIPASRMSFHLKVLRDADLVVTERYGQRVRYRLAERALERMHAALPTTTTSCELVCVPVDDDVVDIG